MKIRTSLCLIKITHFNIFKLLLRIKLIRDEMKFFIIESPARISFIRIAWYTCEHTFYPRCFSLAYVASGESLSRSFEHCDRHVLVLFFATIRKNINNDRTRTCIPCMNLQFMTQCGSTRYLLKVGIYIVSEKKANVNVRC